MILSVFVSITVDDSIHLHHQGWFGLSPSSGFQFVSISVGGSVSHQIWLSVSPLLGFQFVSIHHQG
jgi:hypothetical protein